MNSSAARIGYARVSTADQNLDAQLAALQAARCTMVRTETGDGATLIRCRWPVGYLERFLTRLLRLWMKVLRRRSQKDRHSWSRMQGWTEAHWPKLAIRHPWPDQLRSEHLADKRNGSFFVGVVENFPRRSLLDDAAMVHEHNLVRNLARESQLVSDNDGRAALKGEVADDR